MDIETKARIAKRSADVIKQEIARQQKNSAGSDVGVEVKVNTAKRSNLKVVKGGKADRR